MTSRLPNPFDAAAEPEPEGEDDFADALIGKTIAGRYRITGVLGRGGMGVVYSGEHMDLERPVAIKVLPGMFSRDSEVLKRFEREARTASKIAHENIVTVYDYGRLETGEPYLIMERLSGRDLDVVLAEKRRFSAKETIDVMVPLAAALDALHAQGVVHRDIKPSNVFFTNKGTVKLVDFGLAVLRTTGERLTQTGSVVGTAEYMAPEAARGVLVDARGDVYSLATVLFELLTGTLPFNGQPVQVLIDKVSHDPPRLSDVSGMRFSEETEQLMASALSRRPETRPASAGELVGALRAALEKQPPTTASQPPIVVRTGSATTAGERPAPRSTEIQRRVEGGRRLGPWIAGALVLLLAAGLGGGAWVTWGSGGDPAQGPEAPIAGPVTPGPAAVEVPVAAPPSEPELPTGVAEPVAAPPTEVATAPVPQPAAAAASTSERRPRAGRAGGREEQAATAGATAATPASAPAATATREEPRGETTTITGDAVSPDEGGAERAAALVREAQSALLRGEVPRARELYREATGASPRNAAAWRGLGLASERLHLDPEAVQAYERYLRVAPSAPDADAIRERIARLSGG